jgi:hypothetical protein
VTGTLPRSLEYRLQEFDAGPSSRDPSLALDARSLCAERSEAALSRDEPRDSSKRCHELFGSLSWLTGALSRGAFA